MKTQSGHLQQQFRNIHVKDDNTLHVVGVITNPARWQSRIRLFRRWVSEMLMTSNVKVYVIEGLFGDHEPECAPEEGQDYEYMSVQLHSELWLKENLLNIAINDMVTASNPRWKYLCWCDCDIHFRDPRWALKAIWEMQLFDIIQPWSDGIALLPDGGAYNWDQSFGHLKKHNKTMQRGRTKILSDKGYRYAHSGYVWCCTRRFWINVGMRLIDFCLIGSGDHHMAWATQGPKIVNDTIHGQMSKGYFELINEWARHAHRACGGRVGCVEGIIEAGFHGPTRQRRYGDRWSILVKLGYDPKKDITYDHQGVINYIGPHKEAMETALKTYNRERLEDSNEQY